MNHTKRIIGIVAGSLATLVVVVALVLSNGPRKSDTPTSVTTDGSKAAPTGPTRWWASPAGGVGSPIDVELPERGAASLKPDEKAYCTMLRSSVSSPSNPLVRQTAGDTNLLLATRAWLAELEALSSDPVSSAWRTVGPALVARLSVPPSSSTSSPSTPGGQAAVNRAISVVSQDALQSCHLDLSKPPS